MNIPAINNPKDLADHVNTVQVMEMMRKLDARLTALENRFSFKAVVPRTKVHFGSHILEIVQPGKIYAVQAIAAEIRERHPEFPKFEDKGVGTTCRALAHHGKLKKIATNVYIKA